MSIKNAFATLRNGIADLSSVEVHTFSGDLTTVIKNSGEQSVIDWSSLLSNAAANTSGSVTLVASSRYEFDGDAQLLVNPKINPQQQAAHNAAVDAGLQVRKSLVDTFYDIIDITE